MDKENNKGSGEKCGASASEEGKEGAGSCKDSMDGDGEDDGSSVEKDNQEEEEDPEYGSRTPATRLCYAQPCCIAVYICIIYLAPARRNAHAQFAAAVAAIATLLFILPD